MIKILKIENKVYQNFEEKKLDEKGNEVWNIPTDLKEFRAMAVDTINWQIGDNVKKALGNTQTNLSASNAKGIVLVSKVLNTLNPNLDGLTDLEKDSWQKMVALADSGYSDSELLNNSLTKVSEYIEAGTDKIARITSANSIENIINILNE